MMIRRILAAALVAVMVIACAAPAFAADSKTNMMLDATFLDAINITAYHTDEGSSFEGLVDGVIAPGPSYTQNSLNAQINNAGLRFDADGNEDENGEYIWIMTYELLNKATLDSFTFYFIDTVPFGDPTTIPWLLHDFDILVSETGAEGSWKLAYRAEELHDGVIDSDYYQFVEGHDGRIDYWTLSGEFEKACDAKFVRIGVPTLTDEPIATIKWVSISEMEIYGKLASGVTAVTKAPETKAPAPVNEAGQTDVIYDAAVLKSVNISGNVDGLVDGKIAPGPTHKEKSLNGQVDRNKRYDVNGVEKEDGAYIWLVAFEMNEIATIETVELDTIDLVQFGDESTVPWLIHDFDVYVSDTGADGSWKQVHHATDLHDGENDAPKYTIVEADDNHMMYWAYAERLAEPVTAKYVTFAVPTLTNDWMNTNNWVNITEFQLYGKTGAAAAPAPATQAPATQAPATQAPATQAPATQAPAAQAPATQAPATQAPTTKAPTTPAASPKTVDSSVVIAVVIAAAASGAVAIGKKKH